VFLLHFDIVEMFSKSLFSTITLLVAARAVSAVTNPIYIISNAEVPSLGRPGLSIIGEQRATQCLPEVIVPLTQNKCGFTHWERLVFAIVAIFHLEYRQNYLLSVE
jgi:hypothetical protein